MSRQLHLSVLVGLGYVLAVFSISCRRTPEPSVEKSPEEGKNGEPRTEAVSEKIEPVSGPISLDKALAGLGKGTLVAEINTDKGRLTCKLFEDKAPVTVANFVGLARGLQPYLDPIAGKWVKFPMYDGTTFHRIIKGFMIQGGDPTGTGMGTPGYGFADEVWAGATHDRAGLLCMAHSSQPNSNGFQFFITDAPAKYLDNSYTIFGECAPLEVIHAIASVPLDVAPGVPPGVPGADRPKIKPVIRKVEIRRQ
jgi:peptidyl-prolyl cis-trans isomerase A (cyclophilin A)